MNAKNTKGENFSQTPGQFDSQFGNSAFGGPANSQFGADPNNPGGNGGFTQGEFGTGFGGETNAVSQIFGNGNFNDEDRRKKYMLYAAVVIFIGVGLGAVWYMFGRQEDMTVVSSPTDKVATPAFQQGAPAAVTPKAALPAPVAKAPEVKPLAPASGLEAAADDVPEDTDLGLTESKSASPAHAMGAESAGSYTYNEQEGGPIVKANEGATIEVSRSAEFHNRYVVGPIRNGQFRIPNPPPGHVYWREVGAQQSHSIQILPPAKLGLKFSAPATIASGEQLSWNSGGSVGFFRLEFAADKSFDTVSNVFATSQKSAALKDLGAGTYFVRLGGLNLSSGKWEYTNPSSIQVQ